MKPCKIDWYVALATEGEYCVVHQTHRDLRTGEIDPGQDAADEIDAAADEIVAAADEAYDEGYQAGKDAAELESESALLRSYNEGYAAGVKVTKDNASITYD